MNASMLTNARYDFQEASLVDTEIPVSDAWLVEEQRSAASLASYDWPVDGRSTTRVGSSRSVFQGYMLSALAAAMFRGINVRHVFQVRSNTTIVQMAWHLDEAFWEASPQLITNEQVVALNELLAMPYVTSPGIGDLFDE